MDGLEDCWRRDSGPLWSSPCLPGLRCSMYLYNIDVPVRNSLHYLVEGNERTSKYDVSRRSDLHHRAPQVAISGASAAGSGCASYHPRYCSLYGLPVE